MDSDIEIDEDLSLGINETIDRLVSASKQAAKSRAHPVQPLVSKICSHAYQRGLSASHLSALIDVLRKPSHLDQSSTTTLIKGLYPANRVPPGLVFGVVASIGQGSGKPSPTTQSLLLNWLVLVREALEDDGALTKCYGVLFGCLAALSTRPTLCHLLAILTRRKHVKPWRILMLLEITKNTGGEPALIGLLRVYKEFYPDIIIDHPVSGRVARFSNPDPEWTDRLQTIQDLDTEASRSRAHPSSSFRVARKGGRASRAGGVPEVHTFRVDENSVSLEEIDGVQSFVDLMERIELPGQLVAALDDPLLRKYLFLRDEKEHWARIDSWLSLFFDSHIRTTASGDDDDHKDLESVLNSVTSFTHFTKSLLPSVENYLRHLVPIWDGILYRDSILELLSYLPLQSFEGLQRGLFGEIEDAILDGTLFASAALLHFYTRLAQNWTSGLLEQQSASSVEDLNALASHASVLALTMLTHDDPTAAAVSAVLEHISAMSHASSLAPTNPPLRIMTPPRNVVYLLAFRFLELATLSQLTSVLATYKIAFETAMTAPPPPPPPPALEQQQQPQGASAEAQSTPPLPLPPLAAQAYPRPYVNEFNGFLMDVCNLLWRSRAFNRTDTNALGCLLPERTRAALQEYVEASVAPAQALHAMFTVAAHPALTALAIHVLREIEDRASDPDRMELDNGNSASEQQQEIVARHAGPVSQKTLAALAMAGGVRISWGDYRLEVLRWLDGCGATGVGRLMFCTMKLLMSTGKGAAGAGATATGAAANAAGPSRNGTAR